MSLYCWTMTKRDAKQLKRLYRLCLQIQYARKIDDDLMVVIEILAFYDDPAPEDYEQLFEQLDGDETQSAANE